MKANELRVTNFVNYKSKFLPVMMIGIDSVFLVDRDGNELTVRFKDIEPILLTEEWLGKFGFDDSGYKSGYIGIDFKSGGTTLDFVLTKPGVMGEWSKEYSFELRNNRFKNIESVHQLQNLFFALSGKELEFSEKPEIATT